MTRLLPDMTAPQTVRVIGAAQVVLGAVTLLFPARLGRAVSGGHQPPAGLVVRVLGARQLGQGVALLMHPTDTAAVLGAGVDATHAASLLPLVIFSSRYRRAAVASAGTAAVAALLEARAAVQA